MSDLKLFSGNATPEKEKNQALIEAALRKETARHTA